MNYLKTSDISKTDNGYAVTIECDEPIKIFSLNKVRVILAKDQLDNLLKSGEFLLEDEYAGVKNV